jgi:DNA-binding phage protein
MDEEFIYRIVASTLQKMVDDGVSVKNISIQTGLSPSTLYKFMRQDTRYPRFHTVMAVLEYLGFQITVTTKGKKHGLRTEHITHQPTSTRLL